MKKKLLNYNYTIFLYFIIFSIPTGMATIFNGLPWTNLLETNIVLIFLLSLFFFNKYLNNFYLKLLLLFILILKFLIISSPQIGIAHKQFFSNEDVKENKYINTYGSFWNKELSAVQTYDWNFKNNYPLDWSLRTDIRKTFRPLRFLKD